MGNKEELKSLERQRLKAGRLLLKGLSQAEVARRVGVARPAVCGWAQRVEQGGLDALRSRGLRGRPASLGDSDRNQLRQLLLASAMAEGFPTEVWTLPRVRTVVTRHFGIKNNINRYPPLLPYSAYFQCATEVVGKKPVVGPSHFIFLQTASRTGWFLAF